MSRWAFSHNPGVNKKPRQVCRGSGYRQIGYSMTLLNFVSPKVIAEYKRHYVKTEHRLHESLSLLCYDVWGTGGDHIAEYLSRHEN